MDDSIDQNIGKQKLNRAQQKLLNIEKKIREFKKQAKVQQTYGTSVPDLTNYISFFKQNKNILEHNSNMKHDFHQNKKQKQFSSHQSNFQNNQKENIRMQNYSQKFLQEKNKTLDKMEAYYNERNFSMDKKIQELQIQKNKLKKDKQLLMRNNKEIQETIIMKKNMFQNDFKRQTNSAIQQLLLKIEQTKQSVKIIQEENKQLQSRKKQLQLHLKHCLKTQRDLLNKDLYIKEKSKLNSVGCQYH